MNFPKIIVFFFLLFLISLSKLKALDQDQVGQDRHYHETTYLVAHNAYASCAYGYIIKQQSKSITDLLNKGVRGFMLDTKLRRWKKMIKLFKFQQQFSISTCHGSCLLNRFQQPFRAPSHLWQHLLEIRLWLENNPQEIVTIILENKVQDLTFLDTVFRAIFRDDIDKAEEPDEEDMYTNNAQIYKNKPVTFMLTPEDLYAWRVSNSNLGWPTLKWMINNNKRLVIFNSNNTNTALLFNEWEQHAENNYSTINPQKAFPQRSESSDQGRRAQRYLLLANYFPDTIRLNNMHTVNTTKLTNFMYNYFIPAWDNRLPNFIAVDEAHKEALNIVNEINERGANAQERAELYKPIPQNYEPSLNK